MKKYAAFYALISLFVCACGSNTSESANQETLPAAGEAANTSDLESASGQAETETLKEETLSASEQEFADEYLVAITRTLSSGGVQGIIADEDLTCYSKKLIADLGIERLKHHEITPYQVTSSSDSSSELTKEERKTSYYAMPNCIDPKKYFVASLVWYNDDIARNDAECLTEDLGKGDLEKVIEYLVGLEDSSDGSKQARDTAFEWYDNKLLDAAETCGVDTGDLP